MICTHCKNYDCGLCSQFGAEIFNHVCRNFEPDSVTAKLIKQTRQCYCTACNDKSGRLIDVQEGILLYKCEKCGKTYTYSIDELK